MARKRLRIEGGFGSYHDFFAGYLGEAERNTDSRFRYAHHQIIGGVGFDWGRFGSFGELRGGVIGHVFRSAFIDYQNGSGLDIPTAKNGGLGAYVSLMFGMRAANGLGVGVGLGTAMYGIFRGDQRLGGMGTVSVKLDYQPRSAIIASAGIHFEFVSIHVPGVHLLEYSAGKFEIPSMPLMTSRQMGGFGVKLVFAFRTFQ